MILIIVGIIVLFVFIFIVCYFYSKQKFYDYEIKLEEAEKNMDIFLEKKIELLNRLVSHMKKKKLSKDLPDIEKYKDFKIDRLTLQFELFDTYTDIIKFVDEHENKLSDAKSISFLDQLSDNEDDLIATVKYYNDCATDFNYDLHRFPTSLMSHFLKKKQLELFRNEKRETFEILKEK